MLNALIRTSLAHRPLVLLAALAVSIGGLIAGRSLPIDVLPDLNRPTVAILTEAPGLAPEEVEAQVTFPIESAVSGAAGVERVRSVSSMGLSIVHVEFGWGGMGGAGGTDGVYRHRQTIQERLAEVRDGMPAGVEPRMGPISSIMGEIMLMGVSSRSHLLSPMEQRSAADWVIRPSLLSIPGIAQVTVMGGDVRECHIKVDPERLRLYGLALDDVRIAVEEAARTAPAGIVTSGQAELMVRFHGRIHGVEQIEGALIATRIGQRAAPDGTGSPAAHAVPVRIRDVARVVEAAPLIQRGRASVMASPAVVLSIVKQPGADTRELTRAIDAKMDELRPALPAGLTIHADLFRQSHFIESSIRNLVHALRDGSILVVIVLVLFLLNARTTIITLSALPLSIGATLIVFALMEQSINTMTLGGIAVAVGELVDDAIVGVENVFRRLRERGGTTQSGVNPAAGVLRTIYDATSEVRSPILIGTIIVLLVFLPLLALPGLPGRLFQPLALAYILSILASMLVSLTVTPVLCHLLLRGTRHGASLAASAAPKDGPVLALCKRLAARAYAISMPHPRIVIALCVLAVAAAAFTVTRIGAEFLPPFNEGTAVVSLTAAPGISMEESDRLGSIAEELMLTIPEVRSVARRTGRAEQDEHALGVNASEIEVDFFTTATRHEPAAKGTRPQPPDLRSREQVFGEMRAKLADIPGLSVSIGQPLSHRIDHLESGVQAQIVVKIFGDDLRDLRTAAEAVRAAIEPMGVADLRVEQQTLVPQLRIRPDADAAARYGFRSGELADAIQAATLGRGIGTLVDGFRAHEIVITLDDPWRADERTIGDLRLVSSTGAVALLSDVARIERAPAPNEILRENGLRRIVVSCNVAASSGGESGGDLGTTAAAIRRALETQIKLPAGCTVSLEGQFQTQARATRLILILSGLSLVAMFVILQNHLRSAVLAAQVMLNIPFAFIGAVGALVIAGQPFSVAALIGMVSLCGIAARNGVLMITHYLYVLGVERAPFTGETIVRASQERVAPVLMTALTTGLAMLPLLWAADEPGKELLYPVAVVVIGGLVTCTLLDFFVTPAVFLMLGPRRALAAASSSAEVLP